MRRRDYTELALLSPQVTKSPNGGLSFAGQHDRYNSIQVDGTNNNNLFGSTASGTAPPVGPSGLNAITPEAVEELQILSAPFDVRYGNFAGGLINAVTKSGTNRVEGSILGYFENSDLTGTDATGSRARRVQPMELGLTFGAPIVRDRVALFVNAALQRQVIPQACLLRVSTPPAGRFRRRRCAACEPDPLPGPAARHGTDPGSFSAGSSAHTDPQSLPQGHCAARGGSRLALSHNYGHGNARMRPSAGIHGFYPLSSFGS